MTTDHILNGTADMTCPHCREKDEQIARLTAEMAEIESQSAYYVGVEDGKKQAEIEAKQSTNQSAPPMDGTAFYATGTYKFPMRYKLYKPVSNEFKRGIKGRWQKMNDYGAWENTDFEPTTWEQDNADITTTDRAEVLQKEAALLEVESAKLSALSKKTIRAAIEVKPSPQSDIVEKVRSAINLVANEKASEYEHRTIPYIIARGIVLDAARAHLAALEAKHPQESEKTK